MRKLRVSMVSLVAAILVAAVPMALAACTVQAPALPAAATDAPQAGIPNPASVFCTQQGHKHEIHTAADGSQSGSCVFADGSVCDEWAYFRGECGPATPASPPAAVAAEATAEPTAENPAENNPGSSMPPETAEKITDWRGVIRSTERGAQFDDYFERRDLGQIIYFGIDSLDPAVELQIVSYRDSGKIVHLYGTLLSNVPDYNGSQIQVDRIEIE